MGPIGQQISAAYTSAASSVSKTMSNAGKTGSAIANVIKDFKMPTVQNVKAEKAEKNAEKKLDSLNKEIARCLSNFTEGEEIGYKESTPDKIKELNNCYNKLNSDFFSSKTSDYQMRSKTHYQEINDKKGQRFPLKKNLEAFRSRNC